MKLTLLVIFRTQLVINMIFNDVADDGSNYEYGAGRAVLRVYSVDYSAEATAAPGSCLPA